jgi:hypothetical protein
MRSSDLLNIIIELEKCILMSVHITHFSEVLLFVKNAIFWDVMPCGSCKNQRFGRTLTSIISVTRIGELGTMLVAPSN